MDHLRYLQFITLLLLCSFAFQHLSFSQETMEASLSNYMTKVRKDQDHSPMPKDFYATDQPKSMFASVQKYFTDSVPDVRRKAYYLIYKIGEEQDEITQKSVKHLTNALKDEDSGVVGNVLNWLTEFRKGDFTASAKDTLVRLLERGTPHYRKLIKLVGFVDVEDASNILIDKLRSKSYAGASEKWAMYIALARMGEKSAVDYCLRIARKMPVNDNFVYEIAPDLVYTRQRPLINYLIEVLNSDEKNCSSPNPESQSQIRCGYRIMEYLAPVVKNFPLKTGPAGGIETDDYKKALKTTRKWFDAHKGDYQLVKDKF
jgi:hypothetical protein